jgi:serine/threonine protein kinase
MEDLIGRQLGSYRVVAQLGKGGMAMVFKAYQPSMDRHVALKVLPRHLAEDDPQFILRFQQEARVLAQLQNPHILPVFDFGETDGYAYLVMPLLSGGTLADRLQGEPLSLSQVYAIVAQVGEALDYAHSRGVVHRDVKPSNVLMDERGNGLLSDFGVAKLVEGAQHFTQTGSIIGTPAYMSPEQGLGLKIDRRCDIYALGVILYEMVTGRVPYEAETPMAVLLKHINAPLPSPRDLNPALPEAVERVIFKALAKDPDERFSTAGELAQALRAALSSEAVIPPAVVTPLLPIPAAGGNESFSGPPTPVLPAYGPVPLRPRTPVWYFIVGGLAIGAIVISLGILLWSSARGREPVPANVVANKPSQAAPILTATVTLPPAPTATDSPTAEPTLTPTPAATDTPSPTPTPVCPEVNGPFAALWIARRDVLGCATGAATSGQIVEQNFVGGQLVWREPVDVAQAVVLYRSGTGRIVKHAPFVEGSPEYACLDNETPAECPPTPRRGFGQIWCDAPDVRSQLGVALDCERSYTGWLQQFEQGFALLSDNGLAYLVYSDGQWERQSPYAPEPRPTSTPRPTPRPTATATSTLAPLTWQPIPLNPIANAALADDYAQPPRGKVTLAGVPFNLDGRAFKSQAEPAPDNAFPTHAALTLAAPRAEQVQVLITAGNAFTRWRGRALGRITLLFDNAPPLKIDLVLGKNLREWHAANNVIASAAGITEAWRGEIAGHPDLTGTLDLLTIKVPDDRRSATLTGIEFDDLSESLLGSRDPAFTVAGVTVAQR